MGWIGEAGVIMDALAAAGADMDEEGRYLLRGSVSTFMGAGEEAVVADGTMCFVQGREVPLVTLLPGGLMVTVI
jgi:hypothetical protein